ncbi:MAG: caspase family protein [Candidatus Electrothrix sp. AW5]|nr:caspase family protein [Candidatus Electrothrix gigas]
MIKIINRCIITALLLLIGTNAWGVNLSGYFGNSYAVVIGIHKYQDRNTWSDVAYGVEDANDMVAFFLRQGFKRNNIKSFTNAQATKGSIISYLQDDLAQRLKNNDRVVFYFSGHGYTDKRNPRNHFGYIVPYNGEKKRPSTLISMETLRELSTNLGNARHQLFILDSCFGGMIEPKGSVVSSEAPIYDLTKRRVRLYMTAGDDDQVADMRSNLSNNSNYTAYILRGLRDGFADTNYNGIVTTSELIGYLREAYSIKGIRPQWGSLDGHDMGEFLFSSPKTARIKHGSNRASSGGDKRYKSQLASGGSIEYSKNEFDALRGGTGQVNKSQSQQSLRISPSCSSKHIKKGDSFVFQVERLSNGKLHQLSRHQVDIKTTGEWKPLRNGSYPYFRLEGKGNTTLQITDKTTGGSTKCSVFFEE